MRHPWITPQEEDSGSKQKKKADTQAEDPGR
jgi:hypothetical protein